jgi:hypothetical protein
MTKLPVALACATTVLPSSSRLTVIVDWVTLSMSPWSVLCTASVIVTSVTVTAGPAMFCAGSPARMPVDVPSMVPFWMITAPWKLACSGLA